MLACSIFVTHVYPFIISVEILHTRNTHRFKIRYSSHFLFVSLLHFIPSYTSFFHSIENCQSQKLYSLLQFQNPWIDFELGLCVKCAIKWAQQWKMNYFFYVLTLSLYRLLNCYTFIIFVLLSLLIYYCNKVYLCDLKWTVIVSVFYFLFYFLFFALRFHPFFTNRTIISIIYPFFLYSSLLTETIVSCDLIRLWIPYALSLHIQFKSKSYLIRVD